MGKSRSYVPRPCQKSSPENFQHARQCIVHQCCLHCEPYTATAKALLLKGRRLKQEAACSKTGSPAPTLRYISASAFLGPVSGTQKWVHEVMGFSSRAYRHLLTRRLAVAVPPPQPTLSYGGRKTSVLLLRRCALNRGPPALSHRPVRSKQFA